ncbi:putative GPI-anchored protein [Cocos nucifera]|uniref:Putative GPI-anchored protein n=1 Tax=Cocos nucifera TaxID=13894 RepID=A0A8K0N2F6_COCNU|nr:putative GPI-anchored protein [Cocos nucifera]
MSLLPGLPVLPDPDPAAIQPSLIFPSSSPQATIPAFPEQSDVAGAACPLDLPNDLLPAVSTACSASAAGRLPSRSRCCPALAAWLYAAYSATALAARPLPAPPALDLPILPDDSEACVGGVERALRDRGVRLPRVNGTCDAAYCYCGIRLRRLTCAGGASGAEGRWVPMVDVARRLERDCSRPGLAGCSRCLRALNQMNNKVEGGGNVTNVGKREAGTRNRECQLMGVTWLLSKNRTHYLPAVTSVLRALMAADATGAASDPTSCSLPHDSMPLAVDSAQIDGQAASSAVFQSPLTSNPLRLLIIIPLILSSFF